MLNRVVLVSVPTRPQAEAVARALFNYFSQGPDMDRFGFSFWVSDSTDSDLVDVEARSSDELIDVLVENLRTEATSLVAESAKFTTVINPKGGHDA